MSSSTPVRALQYDARCLLLLGYKGGHAPFFPTTSEVVDAFSTLTTLGRQAGITIAADDYTRRRLRLAETCGDEFVRISVDGTRDVCCFPECASFATRGNGIHRRFVLAGITIIFRVSLDLLRGFDLAHGMDMTSGPLAKTTSFSAFHHQSERFE